MDAWALALEAIEHKAIQKPQELRDLIERLDGIPLHDILEIGSQDGGTLWLWDKLATSPARLASIDIAGQVQPPDPTRNRVALVHGDSHKPKTLELVKDFFRSGVDLLFIDGDHSYEGAKQDYLDYEPLVRDGGLVAFHDIAKHRDPSTQSEVADFWWALNGDKWWTIFPHSTSLYNDGVLPVESCGIGVLRVVR